MSIEDRYEVALEASRLYREEITGLREQLEAQRMALETIVSLDPDWTQRDPESVYGIARAALDSNPVSKP